MLTEKDILAAGFKEYALTSFSKERRIHRHWQKCYWIDNTKAYFIDINVWDFSKYPNAPFDKGYQAESQFRLQGGGSI